MVAEACLGAEAPVITPAGFPFFTFRWDPTLPNTLGRSTEGAGFAVSEGADDEGQGHSTHLYAIVAALHDNERLLPHYILSVSCLLGQLQFNFGVPTRGA